MQNLPAYIYIVFVVAALLTLGFLYKASISARAIIVVLVWLAVQGVAALSGFYQQATGLPPRFALLIMPPIVFIIMMFVVPKGRQFINGLNTSWLTWLHVVRIPVEVALYGLFIHKVIPQVMTFDGRNFDVVSGLTAPFIAYFGYYKKQIAKLWLLIWNFICLGLLVNVVVTAILSGPFRFQQLAFDQPNIALLYFPFVWLPCFIVPVVLLAHLVSIRQLWISGPKA